MSAKTQVRIPSRLTSAIQQGRCVLLVGSGISKQADPKSFPNWSELLIKLAKQAYADGNIDQAELASVERFVSRGQHLLAGEFLKNKLPRDYYITYLETQFAPKGVSPVEIHRLLFRLNAKFILTTNYDKLIEDAYASFARKSIPVHIYSDPAAIQRKLQDGFGTHRPFLFKLHGDIDDPGEIILTESDYRKLTYDEKGYQLVLASIFINHVVLILGFSLNDPELANMLGQISYALKGEANPDYALIPSNETDKIQIQRLRADFGVEVIPYSPAHNHAQLIEILEALAKVASRGIRT